MTDENELNRWNQILNGSQNKADAERTLSSILNANTSTEYNTKSNKNESTPQKYNNDYYSMRSSSYEVSTFLPFFINRKALRSEGSI